MKKLLTVLLVLAMVLTLGACGAKKEDAAATDGKKTVYVMGPTPDHGWTSQAGAYAEKRVAEIVAEGNYNAQYISAKSGEEQVDQINTIIANGDAAGVCMMALDDTAAAGQEALEAAGIPFISFDRIIEATEKYAVLNYSGDNWAVGAGIAKWLIDKGMQPGDVLVTLWGDNGTVCTRRQQGFEEYLLGKRTYHDEAENKDYTIEKPWTEDEVKALTEKYSTVVTPNWSAEGAYEYLKTQLPAIVADAKAGNGKLYVYSMDDEMTFGFLNLLEGADIDDATKADLENLDVYVSAIGGMQELYDVISGKAAQAPTAAKYFEGLISMNFNPNMMINAINYMLQYLDGTNWTYAKGDGTYSPTWIVDANNVANYEGFLGH